jgi:cell division protein ZipA
MTQSELRLVLIVLGAVVLFLIYWFGRPRKPLPTRTEPKMPWDASNSRISDQFAVSSDPDAEAASQWREEAPADYAAGSSEEEMPSELEPGTRPDVDFDLIITLHVMARDGGEFSGAELVVAAEKTSLVYGAQGLFHRLPDGDAIEPIFSMVNRMMPGAFDLSEIAELRTPGVSFFLTLPNPLGALEAWDRMYASVQRMSGLLAGDIMDEEMNLLGRQRIAAIRDQMRNFDRKQGR